MSYDKLRAQLQLQRQLWHFPCDQPAMENFFKDNESPARATTATATTVATATATTAAKTN